MDIIASNPVLKWYRSRPTGNILELCNIDSCLNEDLHKAVECHVRYTHSLHKLYPKKFITITLKKGTSEYLRILDSIDGVATSRKWIISNMYDLLTSIKYIMESKGCIVPDVKNVKNTRKGRLREAWESKDTNHGRKRMRMLAKDDCGAVLKKISYKDAHRTKYI